MAKTSAAAKAALETIGSVTNEGKQTISYEEPYMARVRVQGAAPFLFHRWSVDSIEAKAKAAKGSKAKKEDDIESYVHRNEAGVLCIPSEYFRMSMVNAGKFMQDPRSPRKSAMDLFKAGFIMLDELCSLGTKNWDYLDRRRAMVQRNGITRVRPAFNTGWKAEFTVEVLLPEYISPQLLRETIEKAGRLVGVGDMRPTFGRFGVIHFEPVK